MFQDIDPHKLAYEPSGREPADTDHVFFLLDGNVLRDASGEALALPAYGQVRGAFQDKAGRLVYLFTVDGRAFYYSLDQTGAMPPFAYTPISAVRELAPPLMAFATATAYHFAKWYDSNRFCGLCGGPMLPRENERCLRCPSCGMVKYPRISPAVIVGVTNGDSLLLTRYSGREYKKLALIAGFVDPGESLEMAIAREVMEEVGLRVTNVRYYKSQPWAFSQSLLMGFFADLEGDEAITVDMSELSEAQWFPRHEVPVYGSRFSLTWDMMQAFRNREI